MTPMMYRVNSKKLRQLIDSLGETGLAKTSIGAKVSVSTLSKMYAGTYNNSPREAVRSGLSSFFQVSEKDLFTRINPHAKDSQRAAAS